MTTTRRDVLKGLSGLVVIGALPAQACGGGDGGGTTDGAMDSAMQMDSGMDSGTPMDSAMPMDSGSDAAAACNSVTESISSNHSHTVTVPPADVATGTQQMYTLTTGLGHTHQITVSAADFAMLQSGQTVMITSTAAGSGPHMHTVTLMCG